MTDRDDSRRPTLRVKINEPEPVGDVGYGRPPRASRFKAGQSGNLRGRPKGAKSQGALLKAELARKVTIRTPNGRTRKITMLEAIIQRIVGQAAKGDLKASAFVLNQIDGIESADPEAGGLNGEDKALLQDHMRKYVENSNSQR